MKITIKGISGACNYSNLSELDGITCNDDFVECMDKPDPQKFESGYMSFEYNKDDQSLYTKTVYILKDGFTITEKEIKELLKYTQGQWSDGIGEGFEQFPCYITDEKFEEDGELTDEVYLSPWYYGQKLEYIIEL